MRNSITIRDVRPNKSKNGVKYVKSKVKRLTCKHINKETKWIYPNGFKYNEFFDVAQTTRERLITCKDCGKILNSILVQWISHEQIYEELKKEYLEKNTANIVKKSPNHTKKLNGVNKMDEDTIGKIVEKAFKDGEEWNQTHHTWFTPTKEQTQEEINKSVNSIIKMLDIK